MTIYTKTDIGLKRNSNQDACSGGPLPGNSFWAVVCDGMGGAKGGNVASALAVQTITNYILQSYQPEHDADFLKTLLITAIKEANQVIYNKSKEDENLRGMGTTVVLAVAENGMVHVAHAGDSRAYLLDGSLRQLTTDHSMVQELVNNGDITEQEARRHPQKNIITRALGVLPYIEIDYCCHEFPKGARLLLCTDGLTNFVDPQEIYQISEKMEGKLLPGELIKRANQGGGGDNITVAIIEN